MITKAKIRNFKSLRDIEINFDPLTVLVGFNGAGKSSVLECLRVLHGRSQLPELGTEVAIDYRSKKYRSDVNCRELPRESPVRETVLGDGLADWMASLALTEPDKWRAVVADLGEIIPTIVGLRFAEFRKPSDMKLLIDTRNHTGVSLDMYLSGIPRLICLLAHLNTPSPQHVLLCEDIGAGLHPVSQRMLVRVIRKRQDEQPNMQVIATCYSPYLLDEVRPEEVRVMCSRKTGSVCAPLTSHRESPKWSGNMGSGEMWMFMGEDWVPGVQAQSG